MSPGKIEAGGILIATTSRDRLSDETEFLGGRLILSQTEDDKLHILEYRTRRVDTTGEMDWRLSVWVKVPKARVPVKIPADDGNVEVILVVD